VSGQNSVVVRYRRRGCIWPRGLGKRHGHATGRSFQHGP